MKRSRLAIVVLVVLAAWLAVTRFVTLHEPLERDITTYAVVGHELNRGSLLYRDVWDHKPPATHLSFAAAERLFGYGPEAVYALNLVALLITLLGVFAAATLLFGNLSGITAAALYTVVSGDLALQANQPNVEVLLNATLTAAIALLMAADAAKGRTRLLFVTLSGLGFTLATLYKINAVCVAGAVTLAFALRGPQRAWRDLTCIVAIGGLGWSAVLWWFARDGRYHDFRDAVLGYNQAYAGSPLWNLVRGLQPKWLFAEPTRSLWPLAAAAAIALTVLVVRDFRDRRLPLLLAWVLATFAAIAAPGRFWPHYHQLWLPVLAVIASGALERLAPRLWMVCSSLMLAVPALTQIGSYQLSPEGWSNQKYGDVFVRTRSAARAINSLLAPGESFYEFGSETGLYFETRRSPPASVFYDLPLRDGPLREDLTDRVLNQLARAPPEIFVMPNLPLGEGQPHAISDWAHDNYQLLVEDVDGFALWVLKDGKVATRVATDNP